MDKIPKGAGGDEVSETLEKLEPRAVTAPVTTQTSKEVQATKARSKIQETGEDRDVGRTCYHTNLKGGAGY